MMVVLVYELPGELYVIIPTVAVEERRIWLSNDRVPRCALSGTRVSEHSWWYLSCSLVRPHIEEKRR